MNKLKFALQSSVNDNLTKHSSMTCKMTIDDIHIEVVRKKIKNLYLRVYPPHGNVRLSAPSRVRDEELRRFAVSKLPWIKQQQAKFQAMESPAAYEFIAGELHPFQGKSYRLDVIEQSAPPDVILRNDACLELRIRPGSSRQQRERVLMEWYRNQLKAVVPPLLQIWQLRVGVEIAEWRIKRMKTRWGTCNRRARRIWLNLELSKHPQVCLEYVLAHELTHLLEQHHNARFRRLLDRVMPEWRTYKARLNQRSLR